MTMAEVDLQDFTRFGDCPKASSEDSTYTDRHWHERGRPVEDRSPRFLSASRAQTAKATYKRRMRRSCSPHQREKSALLPEVG